MVVEACRKRNEMLGDSIDTVFYTRIGHDGKRRKTDSSTRLLRKFICLFVRIILFLHFCHFENGKKIELFIIPK